MDSKGNVRHFFGVLFAWRGFESCCCSSVSEAFRQRLSKLETLASDAIFLRFRWGSAVLGVLEGASSNGFVFSLMDSKGNVRHFFGVVFAWHGLESCCCSAVLEGASSNGFVSSLMDSKGNVRHFFGVLFAWRGFEFCCCSSVSEAFRERLLCTSLIYFFNGFQR